ncbi:MAG: hypothetical protein IPM82_28100 [Saprospiraceae bacterium]|nr:hypothetical protein [Saprospiraceae bacterium]
MGEKHYVWRDLKAKEFYFRAMTIREENYPDSSADWRLGEKRRLLEKSLEWDSTSAVAYYQLGKAALGTVVTTIDMYSKAADISPNWALIHAELGRFLPSEKDTASLLRGPWASKTRELLYHLANKSHFKEDSFIVSPLNIYHLKKAIELDSNFLPSYSYLAEKYDDLGKKDSAVFWRQLYVTKFLKKMTNDTNSVTSFECIQMGSALWHLRDFERAKSVLMLGEKISKGNIEHINEYLAVVYTDLMEFENAIRACEKTAVYNEFSYNNIGSIYFHFLNDETAALEAFAKAENDVQLIQIQFYYSTGNLAKALSQAKKSRIFIDFMGIRFYAAEAAQQMGMIDSANYFYQRIIKNAEIEFVHNQFTPDYLFVALAYSRTAEDEELRLLLESLKANLNEDPWLHFYLACFYAQTQQKDSAISSLQKAIELGWQPNPLSWISGTLCDPLLDPIRETDAYKALVRQHFPKYYDIATRVPGKH